jgi:hypothetical protein
METENFSHKRLPVAVGLLILIALITAFIPARISLNPDEAKYPVFVYFFGVNLSLIVIGTLLIAFYLVRGWFISFDKANKKKENEAEKSHKEIIQKQLNEDAERRRIFERERNQINDMFRLFELAKEKPEEIIDKNKTKEEGIAPKLMENDLFTKKNEIVNIDKLDKLIVHYQSLMSNQKQTT